MVCRIPWKDSSQNPSCHFCPSRSFGYVMDARSAVFDMMYSDSFQACRSIIQHVNLMAGVMLWLLWQFFPFKCLSLKTGMFWIMILPANAIIMCSVNSVKNPAHIPWK